MGSPVEVRHYQPVLGAKSHVGELVGRDSDGTVTIVSGGEMLSFPSAQVAQVRLRLTI